MPSEDRVAQTEAWIRKKPLRIIQNQVLIELLIAEVPVASMIGVMMIFYAVSIFPLAVSIILMLWIVASAVYIGYRVFLRVRRS